MIIFSFSLSARQSVETQKAFCSLPVGTTVNKDDGAFYCDDGGGVLVCRFLGKVVFFI